MEIRKILFSSFILLFFMIELTAQSKGIFTDPRDGKEYKTITYDNVYAITWMAENLNFEIEDSFCANDLVDNCEKYGRLYTWFAAKKACPEGWHLPTDKEWNQLADWYGGLEVAGKELRTGDFDGVLGGMRDPMDGTYHRLNKAGFFWSATEVTNKPEEAYDWSFVNWSDKLRHWEGGKFIGNSCRCVKDTID